MPAFKVVYDNYRHTHKVYVEIQGYFHNYWCGLDKSGQLRPWWHKHPRFKDAPYAQEDADKIIDSHLIRRRDAKEKKLKTRYVSKIEYISDLPIQAE